MKWANSCNGPVAGITRQVPRPPAMLCLCNRSHRSSTGLRLNRPSTIKIRKQDEYQQNNNEYEDS